MYATKLWEDRYGSINQMTEPDKLTMTQMLYYVYACMCNAYFYQQEPIPFDFDTFLANIDMDDTQTYLDAIGKTAGSKKK